MGSNEIYIDLTAYKTYNEVETEIKKEINRLQKIGLDNKMILKIIFENEKFRKSFIYEQIYDKLYSKYKKILQA